MRQQACHEPSPDPGVPRTRLCQRQDCQLGSPSDHGAWPHCPEQLLGSPPAVSALRSQCQAKLWTQEPGAAPH